METIKITGEARTAGGSTSATNIRKEGKIPCVVYGGGESTLFSLNPLDVRSLVYTPDFKLAEITVDGKTTTCILKDIQMHPVTDSIMHIDFLKLVDGHPVKLDVPVRCVGVSPGVKVGGKLQQKLRKIRIKTVPEKIVDHLTVDISALELGDSVRVRDIDLPEGIEIMNPMANPVASVEIPRALRSAQNAEGKAGEVSAAE